MTKAKQCYLCGEQVDKNSIGLCKKLLSMNSKRYFCIDCLAGHLDVTVEDLMDKIEDFKQQGCELF